ncbi:MAG: enoyl-CoA hydratase/isomerase family protein [Anaerolineales bacterium]|nr:enoyl-CoA hydratase/isomerase family protein [Anaerolineales bacterium]
MSELIQYQLDANGVAVLRVNRPQARNALNWAMQAQFADVVTAVAQEPSARVLIITGAGERAFVSGGDLKELYLHPEPEAAERLNRVMGNALAQLTELPIPVIGAINGDAFGGGCEIVTACDLRIATQSARFSFAQVKNGLTTGWGGAGRLVRLVGQSRALELLLTARLFDAQAALELGLIHRTTSMDKDVFEAAMIWALDLVNLPRQALAAMKALTYAAGQQPLSKIQQYETQLFVNLWATPDHLEALAAFGEKREPVFNQNP